jgi:hypothetical protein
LTRASRDDLLAYLADLVQHLERFAVTLLPPDDRDEISLSLEADGSFVIHLAGRLPVARRSKHVDLSIVERWRPAGTSEFVLDEYGYELRDHELGYRRALHRHDVDAFVGSYGHAVHEHCKPTIGVVDCDHYAGDPVQDAFDAFERLYGLWLAGERPDCSTLPCLG